MQPSKAETMTIDMDAPPTGAARIGADLRGVRERLGWKLTDVAAGLCIRLPYLEAIERGELSALPGAAYQTGFVRTYAQALGLDPDEILRRFRAEGMGVATKAELSFLSPVPDRAVPTGAIVLLGVVVVLAAYGLWYRHTETERRLVENVPALPAELAPLALPKPVEAPPPAPMQQVAKTPAPAVQPPPVTPAPALPLPATPAPTESQAAAAPAPPATPAPAPAASQTIMATADSWIEVRDPTGNILLNKTLHAGDSWPVPDTAGLTMTAGNAGATEIAQNGKTGAPLGAAGTVLRNFALTPPATTPTKTN
jgi:cytoskeleton protein RodZ